MKQIWKSVGERKMLLVIEGTSDQIESMLFNTPLAKKLGHDTTVKVSEVNFGFDKTHTSCWV